MWYTAYKNTLTMSVPISYPYSTYTILRVHMASHPCFPDAYRVGYSICSSVAPSCTNRSNTSSSNSPDSRALSRSTFLSRAVIA